MSDITLNIHTQDGAMQTVEAPPDMSASDFLTDIIDHLGLPVQDANGHRISWVMVDKDISSELKLDQSLEINGVRHDHHLYLRRQVIAGARCGGPQYGSGHER